MLNKIAGARHRKRILIVALNHPLAEQPMLLRATARYIADYASSEDEVNSLLRYRRYDIVLVSFYDSTDAGKADTMCREIEMLSPRSVVGWLTTDIPLTPCGYSPTLVWEPRGLDYLLKRNKALAALGQNCRPFCVLSEKGECAWGIVGVHGRRGVLTSIIRKNPP